MTDTRAHHYGTCWCGRNHTLLEAQELNDPHRPGADVPVAYLRRTLNCGHLDLIEAATPPVLWDHGIGTLTACYVCPSRPDNGYPRGTGRSEVATVRQVVDAKVIMLDREPASPASIWWYW